MKLSLTPALGFSAAPSPRPEGSIDVLRTRPKDRQPITTKAVRPVIAEPIPPSDAD